MKSSLISLITYFQNHLVFFLRYSDFNFDWEPQVREGGGQDFALNPVKELGPNERSSYGWLPGRLKESEGEVGAETGTEL